MTAPRAPGFLSVRSDGARRWSEHARLLGGATLPVIIVAVLHQLAIDRSRVGFVIGSVVSLIALAAITRLVILGLRASRNDSRA